MIHCLNNYVRTSLLLQITWHLSFISQRINTYNRKMYKFFTIAILLLLMDKIHAMDEEMTVNIDPGREECFYQHVAEKETIDIEYQVIDGGHGDLDITFHLADPTGRILAADYKKSENNHRTDARLSGDYKICFDNTFSKYNSKTVFFEFIVEKEGEEEWSEERYNALPEEIYEVTVEEISAAINRVRANLKSVRHLQDLIKSSEARDRNTAEENYFIVNSFSFIQIVIMAFVGFVQVVMVKSLFDDKSKVHGIWQKLHR